MFAPTEILGRAIRLPLRAIPKTAVLPILSGPNKGLRWIVGAGTHGCWLGRYERQEIEWFLDHTSPQDVVWDIGAHAGFFAMACARRCRHVVACEAMPGNVRLLGEHLRINRIENITVVDAAVSSTHNGEALFGGSSSSYQNQLGTGAHRVTTVTIDGLITEGRPAPQIIKMDIEGAEEDAFQGAANTISRVRPKMLVAVHSENLKDACRSLLESAGYRVEMLNIATLWATP
jgi:FkbM family methyltransferase